tara:strand:- start:14 stop:379 length:366 start_codon:yes stop_codon:yes gene_type:complete
MNDVLNALEATLETRKQASPNSSYVAGLYAQGLNKILEKVAEETTEVILAAKDCHSDDRHRDNVIGEVADLWFHSMVMLSYLNLSHQDVLDKLGERFNISGLEEKKGRTGHNDNPSSTHHQ